MMTGVQHWRTLVPLYARRMTSFLKTSFAVTSVLLLCASAACSAGTSSGGIGSSGNDGGGPSDGGGGFMLAACTPLTSETIAVPTPLYGIGKDKQGTLYVAAGQDPGEYTPRVFILESGALQEQQLIGSGTKGGGADVSYSIGFMEAGATYATARNLLMTVSGGKATAMALGATTTKGFIGDPSEANDEVLALQPESAIANLTARGLPLAPEHIGTLADGTVLVVLRSTDSLRIFYGPKSALDERSIRSVGAEASDESITFDVNGEDYVATYHYVRSKSGEGGTNGMGDSSTWTLETPSGTMPVKITFDATTLSGASFQCLEPTR